jgi:hypothetical protein
MWVIKACIMYLGDIPFNASGHVVRRAMLQPSLTRLHAVGSLTLQPTKLHTCTHGAVICCTAMEHSS